MMPTQSELMGARYNELRGDGMSGQDATAQVNREFGTSVAYGTLRGYAVKAKKAGQDKPTTDQVDHTTDDATRDTTEEVEPTTSNLPHNTGSVVKSMESLTDVELATVRKIVAWWALGGKTTMERLTSVPVADLRARPTFPGRKFNSGIRVNKRLLDAARAKCEAPNEAQRTGGSLSSLIEVLLWSYLGNDERFLTADEGYNDA